MSPLIVILRIRLKSLNRCVSLLYQCFADAFTVCNLRLKYLHIELGGAKYGEWMSPFFLLVVDPWEI